MGEPTNALVLTEPRPPGSGSTPAYDREVGELYIYMESGKYLDPEDVQSRERESARESERERERESSVLGNNVYTGGRTGTSCTRSADGRALFSAQGAVRELGAPRT